jgi:hypothetical protein
MIITGDVMNLRCQINPSAQPTPFAALALLFADRILKTPFVAIALGIGMRRK